MSRGKEIIKEITLSGDTFTLTILIKDDLTPYTKEDKWYGFGNIKSDTFPEIFWGNLAYFDNLDKIKKESLKKDFDSTSIPPKGWFKELKQLIAEAKKYNYL